MNTQLKRLIATARQVSSTDSGFPAPELRSRSRFKLRVGRGLDVREWAEGQGFAVKILRSSRASVAALPLSFPGRFQYG